MTLKRPSCSSHGGGSSPVLKFTPSERHDVAATIVVSTPLMLSPRREERTTTTTTPAPFILFRTPTPTSRQSRRRNNRHRVACCVFDAARPCQRVNAAKTRSLKGRENTKSFCRKKERKTIIYIYIYTHTHTRACTFTPSTLFER